MSVEIQRGIISVLTFTFHKDIKKFFLIYILLTVHPGMILVNNQLDAQFFMYVYFYSVHVSGSHVPVTRRIIVSMRHLVYVTL